MITDLAGMVHDRLALYLRKNGKLPKRILFFRDGVSEGQFSTVTKEELPKIRQACSMFEKVQGPYRPKITLVGLLTLHAKSLRSNFYAFV